MSWNRDFTQHGTFMLSCYVMLSWYAMLCHDVMLLNMLLCYVIICNLFMLCYVVVLCHVMNYYVMLSCYDMSFCNVMMSCYAEVVKQVTVLVVTTCESVHSHLLLSPCTALELATCTVHSGAASGLRDINFKMLFLLIYFLNIQSENSFELSLPWRC